MVEQNRDGQLRTLLINECEIAPDKLKALCCFDGMPVTARWIIDHVLGGGKATRPVPAIREVKA